MLSVIQVQVSSTIEARVDDQSSVWMKKIPPASIWPGQLALCFLPFFFLFFFFWFFFPFFFFVLFFHSSTRSEYLLKCAITRISSMYIYIYIYIVYIYILEIDSAAGILVAALPLSLFLFDRFVRLLLSYIRFITIFVWKRIEENSREKNSVVRLFFAFNRFVHSQDTSFYFFRHLKRYV